MSTQAIESPKTDLLIQVPEYTHVQPVSRDTYRSLALTAKGSTDLVHTGRNYHDSLLAVPEGFRMSDLEEVAYLIEREKALKADGKSPREALNDPIFERFIKGNPYRWEWTARAFRAPNGKKNFNAYVEKDEQGREYVRADLVRGEKVIAEGVTVPKSRGGKVVEWNTVLRIPAVVSEGDEPNHTTHHYLDTDAKEVAVELGGGWHDDERGRCLDFDADYRRSNAHSNDAFRLFEGSLDDLQLPNVERFVKDRGLYFILTLFKVLASWI